MNIDFDQKIFEGACKEYFLEVINESKHLREKLTLLEHAKMYQWAQALNFKQMLSVLLEQEGEHVDPRKIRDFQSTWTKMKKYSLAAFVMRLFPVTMPFGLFLTYWMRKMSDPCRARCGRIATDKRCVAKCEMDAIKGIVAELQKGKAECRRGGMIKNPEKCERKFDKQIFKWGRKYQKRAMGLAKV